MPASVGSASTSHKHNEVGFSSILQRISPPPPPPLSLMLLCESLENFSFISVYNEKTDERNKMGERDVRVGFFFFLASSFPFHFLLCSVLLVRAKIGMKVFFFPILFILKKFFF